MNIKYFKTNNTKELALSEAFECKDKMIIIVSYCFPFCTEGENILWIGNSSTFLNKEKLEEFIQKVRENGVIVVFHKNITIQSFKMFVKILFSIDLGEDDKLINDLNKLNNSQGTEFQRLMEEVVENIISSKIMSMYMYKDGE